jgi:tRNA (cmo5U34)-methyltransferase
MMQQKDRLYGLEITEPGDFVFDRRVVSVFPDMINRSIPGYGTIVPMIGMMARRYATPGSTLYDLGCSLGAASLAMSAAVRVPVAEIVAVDNSPDMIARLDRILEQDIEDRGLIHTRVQDILQTEITNASVVVLNFTLQFIEPTRRRELLERIFAGLNPGGVLLLSEKIRFEDSDEQELQTEWHHDFKRAQGYSDLEIAAKRDALEHVMIPESLQQHRERLEAVGFDRCYRWFQGFNFISLAAFRKD